MGTAFKARNAQVTFAEKSNKQFEKNKNMDSYLIRQSLKGTVVNQTFSFSIEGHLKLNQAKLRLQSLQIKQHYAYSHFKSSKITLTVPLNQAL